LSLYETNGISVSAEPIPKHTAYHTDTKERYQKFYWYVAGTGKI